MKQQALLVIDLQNDFTRAEGKLPACTAEVDEILPIVNAAVAHWHAHGRPVLVLTTQWGSWLMRLLTKQSVAPGTRGAALDTRLSAGGAAHLVKPAKSIFTCPELATWLEAHDVTQLVLCGLAAEHCITASTLQALKQGYEVSLLTDAIASYKTGARAEVFRSLSAQGAQLHTQASLSISAG
jgi:nicotinamidase-related amidase